MFFAYIILFILGLGIGSFLNVVSLRYKPDQRIFDFKIIGGRSRCQDCGNQLKWYELFPLFSFISQKGKCRNCGNKLSWQYPIVEMLSGLIFVFIPLYLNSSLKFLDFTFLSKFNFEAPFTSQSILMSVLWILVFLSFLLLSIIDFRHSIIPDQINIFLAVLGVVITFLWTSVHKFQLTYSFVGHYALLLGSQENIWTNRLFGAFIGILFVGLIILISRGRGMGMGDLKLVAALGLIFGWPDVLLILFLAFIIGSIFVLPMLIRKQKGMKDAIPFGPFIIVGAVLVFFFGFEIMKIYFTFFPV